MKLSESRLLVIGKVPGNKRRQFLDTDGYVVRDLEELPAIVLSTCQAGGIIVGKDLFPYIARLNEIFRADPSWRCKINRRDKGKFRQGKVIVRGEFVPDRFGFVYKNGRNNKSYWYRCLDLSQFSEKWNSEELLEIGNATVAFLEMLDRRGITSLTTSRGSVAKQLLSASPYWDKKDRKPAPKFINDLGREHLPGNHYSTSVDKGTTTARVYYLDQDAAHHNAALTTAIPNPNSMRARGADQKLLEGRVNRWIDDRTKIREFVEANYGLYAVSVTISSIPNKYKHFYPAWAQESGRKVIYLHSNEWEYFEWLGITLEYLVAAWVSPSTDKVLPEFAEWALKDIREHPEHKQIKKPTALAVYGILASRTDRVLTSFHANTEKGQEMFIPIAGDMQMIQFRRRGEFAQSKHLNVIARGVIEAETRLRTLRLAREFELTYKMKVIQIYADGIIVETGRLPLLPPGWRVASELTHHRVVQDNAFTSLEMSKLPGIPQSDHRRMAAARMPFGHPMPEATISYER